MLILCALLLVYIPCVGLLQFLCLNEIHYELYIKKNGFLTKRKTTKVAKEGLALIYFKSLTFRIWMLNIQFLFVFSILALTCVHLVWNEKLHLVCIWALKLFIIFSLTIFSWCLKPYGVLGTMCLPYSHLLRNLVSSN